jgi:hypothetical protein
MQAGVILGRVQRSDGPGERPEIDVVDSTWIGAPAVVVGAVIGDPRNWGAWWPQFQLEVAEARGVKGVRWTVRGADRRRLAGSMEIWLQPDLDGVVAHYFLRLDRRRGGSLRRGRRNRLVRRYRARAKRVLWAVGDAVDPERMARIAAPSAR